MIHVSNNNIFLAGLQHIAQVYLLKRLLSVFYDKHKKYSMFCVIYYLHNWDRPITTTTTINSLIFRLIFYQHQYFPSQVLEWDLKTTFCLVSFFWLTAHQRDEAQPLKAPAIPVDHDAWTRSPFSFWRGNKLPSKHTCNQAANKYTRKAWQECSHS